MKSRLIAAVALAIGSADAQAVYNLGATGVPVPGQTGKFDFTVSVQTVGASARSVGQVHLILSNTEPADGFGCHLISSPASQVMYLADDLEDWGPNERDRYIAEVTPTSVTPRYLQPQVTADGVLEASANLANAPNDWPNNSQCTLYEDGSSINFSGQYNVSITFRVLIKPQVRRQLWMRVSSLLGANIWSQFTPFGPYIFDTSDRVNQTPVILPTWFEPASSSTPISLGTGSGRRDVFYFRFRDPNGSAQMIRLKIHFSSSPYSTSNPGGVSSCMIEVGPTVSSATLYNDLGQLQGYSLIVPTSGTMENYQCILHGASSQVQFLSKDELLVRLDVEFKSTWPVNQVYLHRSAFDDEVDTGFQNPDGATYAISPLPAGGMTLEPFRTCIGSSGSGTVCQLTEGTFEATTPLVIGRSNITIRGASKFKTVLRRRRVGSTFAASEKIAIMTVATPGPPLSGVTITDLAFDGNRTFNEGLGDPGVANDLSITNVDGSMTAQPITVRNCRFINSPGSAISMQPAIDYPVSFPNTQPTRGIRIEKNEFRRSRRAPVHVALNGEWWPVMTPPTVPQTPLAEGQIYVYGQCDTGLPAASTVDDVVVQNNLFEENDTGALGINNTKRFGTNYSSGYSVRAYRNVFLDNYDAGADCNGGVIAVLNCAHDVEIRENFMWNRNVLWDPSFCPGNSGNASDRWAVADAMELWGTQLDVVGNRVEYFSSSGIAAAAVQGLSVTGNKIFNTNRGIQQRYGVEPSAPPLNSLSYEYDRPGIQVSNCGESTPSGYRSVQNVFINANEISNRSTIYQSYGVRFSQAICSGSTDTMQNVFVDQASPFMLGNRQGPVCRAFQVGGLESYPVCPEVIRLGTPSNCGTSGCQ